jgi:hypothetical protein
MYLVTREVTSRLLYSPGQASRNVVEISNRATGTETIQQKAIFYCSRTDSTNWSTKAEAQEQRGLTLNTFACRLQKQKAKFNPYMFAYNSIGYFTPPHTHTAI